MGWACLGEEAACVFREETGEFGGLGGSEPWFRFKEFIAERRFACIGAGR